MEFLLRRPVVLFCLALITGIVAAGTGEAIVAFIFLLLLAAFCLLLSGGCLKGKHFLFAGVLLFYIVGLFEFSCLERMNQTRFDQYKNLEVEVTGYVDSEPEIKGNKVSYIIETQSVLPADAGGKPISGADSSKVKGKLLLSTIYNENSSFFKYGAELKFKGRLELPRGVRNPGGFDYRRYLAQKGVSGTIFVTPDEIKTTGGQKDSIISGLGRATRQRINNVIERSLPEQQAGLLEGILIGHREGLSKEARDAFSDAGLTHIMAVSGANVAFLILPLAFLFKKLNLKRVVSCILTILFLVFFLFVVGFEPSVLRAVIMAVFILIGNIVMKEADTYTSIALAALLILLFSPYMLFDAGFLLSFAATLSIVLFYKNIRKLVKSRIIPDKAADVIAVTLAAQAGVLPIILLYFNKISLISVISNLFVVPILEIVTVLGALMAVLGQISMFLSELLGYVNSCFLSFILLVAKLSSDIPFSTIKAVTPSIPVIVVYYITLWYLLWYIPTKNRRLNWKLLSGAAAIIAVVATANLLMPGELKVTFLDVGEGDSTLIVTSTGRTVLIDGGGSTNPNNVSGIGESVVIPFLLDSGVSKLDLVVASHGHADHIQGLKPVLEQMKVSSLIIPSSEDLHDFDSLAAVAFAQGTKIKACSAGDVIRLDKSTQLEVLFPIGADGVDYSSLNNASLVLKLHYGDADILFTGDAQKQAEQALLKSGEDLGADVIKIAHHGSDSSTCEAFLNSVKPRAAVISVGRNSFGHPSEATLKLLVSRGIKLYRTDEAGAVILTSTGRDIKITGTVGNE